MNVTLPVRVTFGLLTLVLAVSVRGLLLAQQPPPTTGSGFISGQVVEGGTTKAVPGANVALMSVAPRGAAREVIADAQGRYVFANLPAGEYRLTARKNGWRGGAFGLDTPAVGLVANGDPIRLGAGERFRANVPVWRPALISGRVLDETGEPLTGARVNAARWTTIRGRRSLGGSGTVTTDDRGYFTLSIDPGEYMLSATAESLVRMVKGRPHVFRPMFYPGSFTTVGASTIAVKSGEERNGLVMQMSLEPAFRITGVVNRIDAGKMPAQIELQRLDGESRPLLPRGALDASGRFAFDSLPAGRYVLQTVPSGLFGDQEPSDNMELWARVSVDVADRDLDLSVDLRRRLIVSGRVRFEGTIPQPAPGDAVRVGVRLFREDELPLTDVSPRYTPVAADGSFAVAVTPGRYVVAAGVSLTNPRAGFPGAVSRSWTLRTATLGGRDTADVPFVVTGDVPGLELTFTDQPSTLRGQVAARQGRIEGAELMVFPVDETLWAEFPVGRRFRSVRLPAEGTFEVRNLPEGNYFVAAVRNAPSEFNAWVTPEFLATLARTARRVTVLEGQTTTQDVEVMLAPGFNAALAPPPTLEPADRAVVRGAVAATPAGATISGTVLAVGSSAPIAGARVGLTQGVVGLPNIGGAYTDDQGHFVLTGVPAGTHTLYITRPPFVNTVFGASRPNDPGTPVTVMAGQQMSGLTIHMTRGASIGGTVLDQNGQPLRDAQVSLWAYRWTARGRELLVQRGPAGPGQRTNARGEFRSYGLSRGDYVIQATVQGAMTAMPVTTQADIDAAAKPASAAVTAANVPVQVTYAPMFYPNTPDPGAAQAVRLEPGDDRSIDFQFRLIPTSTVSGVVRTPDGQVPSRLSVNLAQNDPLAAPVPRSHFGAVDTAGAFTIRGVPPGRYLLTTSQIAAGSAPLAGALELFVDRDVSNVVLDVVPMTTVAGTIRGDVSAALRQPTVRLSLTPQPGTLVPPNQARSAVIAADNRFSIPNIPPGRYRFEITGPNNLAKPRVATQAVNGVVTGDVDVEVKSGETLNVDLELIASEAQVSGRLRTAAGQAATELYVVLFPKDPKTWTPPSRRVFALRPDQTGRYVFPDVPAGEYLIAGLAGVEAGDWFDPAVLARLAGNAAPVTVSRGDALEIELETR
jgi:protocatechuate 3,4-dioxygenase beta subunit